jgi:hypothetical protein
LTTPAHVGWARGGGLTHLPLSLGGEGGGMAGGCRVAGYMEQILTRLSPSEEGWKLSEEGWKHRSECWFTSYK